MAVELVCWQTWWNGPLDGLARWRGEVYWFAMLENWEEGDGHWGYDYGLYKLDGRRLREVVWWFREKDRRVARCLASRPEPADEGSLPRYVINSRMSLQGSDGPDLPGPVAWFRHRNNPAWYPVNCQDRWRLPSDWPEGLA